MLVVVFAAEALEPALITWLTVKVLGLQVLWLWLIDAPRILFAYLFEHTFVYALWSDFQSCQCQTVAKGWLTVYAKFAATQQQTSNKHFTNCHWQLGAFALFILAHKRLYMIMQPLTSNSVRARPVRPRATVAVAWHTCVIAGSPLDVFFPPHIFSFSIFPPNIARFV